MGKKEICLYSIFSLINIGLIIGSFYYYAPFIWKYFCYMTLINLTISSIYIFVRLYYEVMDHLGKSFSLETRHFWYHHFYKYNFILSSSILIVYWLLCALGKDIMTPGDSWEFILISIYLHGILCLFIIADFFICERKHTDNHKFDYMFLGGMFTVYYGVLYMCKYIFEFMVYPFLIFMNFQQLLVLFMIITLVNFNAHQLYHYLIDKKHKRNQIANTNYNDIERTDC